MLQRRVKFIIELITWSARACTSGVPALRHEIGDHTVKDGIVVKAFPRQEHKIVDRARGFRCIQAADDIAHVSFKGGGIFRSGIDLHFRGFGPLF